MDKKLIILVDDNPANLRIGKNVLAEKYSVATAPSAEKLFLLLENNSPSMILLDIDMPIMNGYDTIKLLKSNERTSAIPVIFLTAKCEPDDELEGLSLGAVDYVTKPFNPALLLKRIEVHLLVEEQKNLLKEQASELLFFNKNLRRAFSTYLSVDVVEEIVANPSKLRLGGTSRVMTAMFADLQNFTGITENMTAESLIDLLNHYFTMMSNVILDQNGTIDKYEGDAIMSFFGAPLERSDHAYSACASAILMKRIEVDINRHILAEGMSPSPLYTRIGINTGNMIVGNMGTDRKMNYTVVSSSVNLASRLESANKYYGTWVLASEHTINQTEGRIFARKLDRIRVLGAKEPTLIYEVMDFASDIRAQKREFVETFHRALELFEQRDFAAAEPVFVSLLAKNPNDHPSNIYVNRCRSYMQTPPDKNWNGVFTMEQK
ncbi:hypothetical protein FACS189487_04030 [Campylobacterota bacterium]|nr:hypothetical protein FACS189487_04030 [Campylobacterota bacterium]